MCKSWWFEQWWAIVGWLAFAFLLGAGTATAGELEFSLENSYRRDALDWNIAGDMTGQNPNILSELTWEDLKINQLSAEVRYRSGQYPVPPVAGYLKGRVAYGWIYAGKNQDSDYDGDNRSLEFSRSNNNADDGYVFDVLAGGGPRFAWWQGRLTLAPLIGYSYHRQELMLSDGYQTIPAYGAFAGLDSSYTAEWYGPWVGADAAWQPLPRLAIGTTLELHAVTYAGEGNWNLRGDLQHPRSFAHEGNGSGLVLALQGEYRLVEHLSLAVQGRLERWQVEDGDDTVYLADGTIGRTRLNEVNHTVSTVSLGLNWSF